MSTDHDLLVSIAQLLTEELAVQRHLLAAFERLTVNGESGGEERLPSIAVEDRAKGESAISTKSYDGRPLMRGLVDEHLAVHAYAKRRAAELQLNAWSETLDLVRTNGGLS